MKMINCITCENPLPHTREFFFVRKGDVLRNECKQCMRGRKERHIHKDKSKWDAKRREIGRRYYYNNLDKVRQAGRIKSANQKLKRFKSDLSLDELFHTQEGRCRICHISLIHPKDSKGLTPQSTCIDHDHNTGKARGLLCSNCNKGLGLFTDNKEKLASAIEYLKYYENT